MGQPSTFNSQSLLDVKAVSDILGVGRSWVYRTFALEVPPAKIAGKLRWERRQIDAYIERQRMEGVR